MDMNEKKLTYVNPTKEVAKKIRDWRREHKAKLKALEMEAKGYLLPPESEPESGNE